MSYHAHNRYTRHRTFSAPSALVTTTSTVEDEITDDIDSISLYALTPSLSPSPSPTPASPASPTPSSPTLPPSITSGIVIVDSATYSGNLIWAAQNASRKAATPPVASSLVIADSSTTYVGNSNTTLREAVLPPVSSNIVIVDSSTDVGNSTETETETVLPPVSPDIVIVDSSTGVGNSNSTSGTGTKGKNKPNLIVTIPPTPTTYHARCVNRTTPSKPPTQPDTTTAGLEETEELSIVRNRAEALAQLTANTFATSSTDVFTTTTFTLISGSETEPPVDPQAEVLTQETRDRNLPASFFTFIKNSEVIDPELKARILQRDPNSTDHTMQSSAPQSSSLNGLIDLVLDYQEAVRTLENLELEIEIADADFDRAAVKLMALRSDQIQATGRVKTLQKKMERARGRLGTTQAVEEQGATPEPTQNEAAPAQV